MDRVLPPKTELRWKLAEFMRAVLLERLRRCLLDLLKAGERIPADLAGGNELAAALGVATADYNDALENLYYGNVAVIWEDVWRLRTPPDDAL